MRVAQIDKASTKEDDILACAAEASSRSYKTALELVPVVSEELGLARCQCYYSFQVLLFRVVMS